MNMDVKLSDTTLPFKPRDMNPMNDLVFALFCVIGCFLSNHCAFVLSMLKLEGLSKLSMLRFWTKVLAHKWIFLR